MSDENTLENANNDGYGIIIPRPTKPGYVFSHWSVNKPGTTTKVTRSDGTIVEIENDCPPFNFSKEAITRDTVLYAIFVPEVKVEFMNDEELVHTQHIVYGGKAFNPTPDGLRSLLEEGESIDVSISHNQHKETAINKNTGKPRFF